MLSCAASARRYWRASCEREGVSARSRAGQEQGEGVETRCALVCEGLDAGEALARGRVVEVGQLGAVGGEADGRDVGGHAEEVGGRDGEERVVVAVEERHLGLARWCEGEREREADQGLHRDQVEARRSTRAPRAASPGSLSAAVECFKRAQANTRSSTGCANSETRRSRRRVSSPPPRSPPSGPPCTAPSRAMSSSSAPAPAPPKTVKPDESNPRGVPKAVFLVRLAPLLVGPSTAPRADPGPAPAPQEDVTEYIGGPEGDAELALKTLQDTLACIPSLSLALFPLSSRPS